MISVYFNYLQKRTERLASKMILMNDLGIGFKLSILKQNPFILLSNNEFFISLKSFIEINELF